MTRAEYLEFVQESLAFPTLQEIGGRIIPTSLQVLRDTSEVCAQLREAHELYCRKVHGILFPGEVYPWREVEERRHLSSSEIMTESARLAREEGL